MPYSYEIQGLYTQGARATWETLSAETTLKAAKERLKEYRENAPGIAYRWKKVKE